MDQLVEIAPNTGEVQPSLNPQQQVLVSAMLRNKSDVTVNYSLHKNGSKTLNFEFTENDFRDLVGKFKEDPKQCLAMARRNIIAIANDKKLSEPERNNRVKRYLDAYLTLSLELDHRAFPPTPEGRILEGVPTYVPDGLSDMGSSPVLNPNARNREKIRIDKKKVFAQSKDFLYELFTAKFGPKVTSSEIKTYFAQRVAHFVYTKMPYNHAEKPMPRGRSIPLDEIIEEQLAVCRHHALMTQVLLQSLGLTSSLMKSDVRFGNNYSGAHANNIVRIDGKWHLLDSTNPRNDKPEVYMVPLPQPDIDLTQNTYKWKLIVGADERIYESRNNMYYRIMDNAKNPAR